MNKLVLVTLFFTAGCGTLKDASLKISPGDNKEAVGDFVCDKISANYRP